MVALRRNRDFALLQAGQLLSDAGTAATTVAYPLLVLAVSHSAAKAGLVTFARLAPSGVFALPAGLAADRWNRKQVMIAADGVRAAAMAGLAAAVVTGHAFVWVILASAFAEGVGSAFFGAAQAGALRSVVPAPALPAAAGTVEARRAAVRLGGPVLGGALYGLNRAAPFGVDAVSYGFSTLSLLAMRARFQEARGRDRPSLRAQTAEGFRFLWRSPFLRTCAFLYGIGNFIAPGVLLVIVVAARDRGLPAAGIGALSAAVGAGTLAGSLASPLFRRVLSVRQILLMEFWTWTGMWVFVVWPSVYVLAAVVTLFGIAAPVTDSVVVGYRLAMTPDRLLGRVESVRSNISLLVAPLGPLVAGLLLESTSARATIAVLAAVALALQLWGTLSPPIRHAPAIEGLRRGSPAEKTLP